MRRSSDVNRVRLAQYSAGLAAPHPEQHLNPILYSADYLFAMNRGETSKEFIRFLASTSNMQLFQTGFIQRFIDFQWNGAFKWFLYAILVSHLVTCGLIFISMSLLEYEKGTV